MYIIYNFSFIKAAISDFWPRRTSYKHNMDVLSAYKILVANFLAHICLFPQTCSSVSIYLELCFRPFEYMGPTSTLLLAFWFFRCQLLHQLVSNIVCLLFSPKQVVHKDGDESMGLQAGKPKQQKCINMVHRAVGDCRVG